jgi:hypothetical protein
MEDSMQRSISLFLLSLFLLSKPTLAADTTYNIRLLSHFNKKVGDKDIGIAGWVITPNAVANSNAKLAIVGPSIYRDGYSIEMMFGGLFADTTTFVPVMSNRFHFSPKFWKAPYNLWGNLQFVNIADFDNMVSYAFVMADYKVKDIALVGIETENYFNAGADEKFNDTSIGPQVVIPYNGVNLIAAYQIHFHENVGDQVWIRAMYHFMPKPK